MASLPGQEDAADAMAMIRLISRTLTEKVQMLALQPTGEVQ